MNWLLSRLVGALLALGVGGGLGYLAGAWLKVPLAGSILGAACGLALVVVRDTLRGARLIEWLRGAQDAPAPRDAGFWGEIGYRAEKALIERERALAFEASRLTQFLSAIEASPNGVLLLDAREQIEWCNSVAADHFGLDPVRDLRQRVTNLVRSPVFVDHLQGGHYEKAVLVPRPIGRGMLSVLVQAYGEGMRLVISLDVTERERMDMMRRDFVANVSHEIRTPLTVLSGFIETLGSLPLTEVERRRVVNLMAQQAQRMQTLVGDLLTLAQLEGSPRPPPDRWVPLARVFEAVEADGLALSAGRHELKVDAVDGVLLAGTEPELLSAVGNLVSNAVRYTPQGGVIELMWRQQAGGAGEIAVRDNGIGIEADQLPRLAERFYRIDQSRSRDTGGTGLGLSIVKHVVQRHGGELDVQSRVGRGSTFRLVFPAARVRCERAAGTASPRPTKPPVATSSSASP